jgi:hypothetical protein
MVLDRDGDLTRSTGGSAITTDSDYDDAAALMKAVCATPGAAATLADVRIAGLHCPQEQREVMR